MAKRKVVWSTLAERETKEILSYFFNRNKSATYSRKLYRLFQSELNRLAKYPEAGLKNIVVFHQIYLLLDIKP